MGLNLAHLHVAAAMPVSYLPTSPRISSSRAEREQVVGLNEPPPGDGRWFCGALKITSPETESRHVGIRV
jgi:hypothetical protein